MAILDRDLALRCLGIVLGALLVDITEVSASAYAQIKSSMSLDFDPGRLPPGRRHLS